MGQSSARTIVAASVALLLGACTTEEVVPARSPETQSLGFVMGRELDTPPQVAVLLREADGKLEADARFIGLCARTERGVVRGAQTRKTRVSTTTAVFAGLFAGTGMALFMWPDLEAEGSLAGGAVLVGIGGIPYLIAAAQTGEVTEELPPQPIERPAAPAPCLIGRASHERIEIRGQGATLEGQTDSLGHVRFDLSVPRPVEVFVRGRRVQGVEWQR